MEVASVLKKVISAAFLIFASGLLSINAAADAPEWLRALAKQPVKTYADDVNVVILLEDQVTTVKDNGDIVKIARRAVRILRPEGRKEAAVWGVPYNSDSKVNYLRGWSITSKGQEYETKSGDIFETSATTYEVYSDAKYKGIRIPGAEVGSVLGFEYEQQEHPYVYQDFWMFQQMEPVERSRYELHLASGWRFKSDWMNHKEEKPREEGGALLWQIADVPRIEREPRQPPAQGLAGGAVFTFLSDKNPGKNYHEWADFGSWYTQLATGVRDAGPALKEKVQQLAPGNLPLLQRIKALAGYAQHDVRYVAVEIGVGGYKPHSATDIFSHGYGDCKDKATVLSSMLAQIGVKSYYIIVNASRGAVTKNSPPTPAGFNHMILAIALPDASYGKHMPALYEHPKLGHLLIFDPTNYFVPFGQIPFYEQDNYGLLVGEQNGELINLPLSNPEANGVTSNSKFKLLADGTLQGDVELVLTGFDAMLFRQAQQNETEQERKKAIERFIGRSIGSFQLDNLELVNVADIDKDVVIRYRVTADHYAKATGPMLLVRPRVVGEMAGPWDTSKPRHYAYEFPAPFVSRDNVEISLPDGFKVFELPDAVKASFPFAQYTSKTEAIGNVLKYSREYKMGANEVPFESVEQLKKLFAEINLDERSMAVLKKTN